LTEDPQVIDEAKNYTGWNIIASNETRNNGNFDALISEGASRGLKYLLNAQFLTQCDAVIGTLLSTWNRKTFYLWLSLGFCTGCPVIDLHKCLTPPCSHSVFAESFVR